MIKKKKNPLKFQTLRNVPDLLKLKRHAWHKNTFWYWGPYSINRADVWMNCMASSSMSMMYRLEQWRQGNKVGEEEKFLDPDLRYKYSIGKFMAQLQHGKKVDFSRDPMEEEMKEAIMDFHKFRTRLESELHQKRKNQHGLQYWRVVGWHIQLATWLIGYSAYALAFIDRSMRMDIYVILPDYGTEPIQARWNVEGILLLEALAEKLKHQIKKSWIVTFQPRAPKGHNVTMWQAQRIHRELAKTAALKSYRMNWDYHFSYKWPVDNYFDQPTNPGPWCHKCPARAGCPDYFPSMIHRPGTPFWVAKNNPFSTNLNDAAYLYKNKEAINKAVQAAEDRLLLIGKTGGELPMYEIAEKPEKVIWNLEKYSAPQIADKLSLLGVRNPLQQVLLSTQDVLAIINDQLNLLEDYIVIKPMGDQLVLKKELYEKRNIERFPAIGIEKEEEADPEDIYPD